MNLAAVLEVDLDQAPPGRRSRLADPLAGVAVLRRTVERFAAAERVAKVVLAAPDDQCPRVGELCAGLPVELEPRRLPLPAYAPHIWSARKWCPGGWRGGLGDTTVFDEYMSPGELARIAQARQADAIVTIPASSALIDPDLVDQVVGHYQKHADTYRLTFTQAPPGMSVAVWQVPLLAELARHSRWPGSLLAYTPERPIVDMTAQDCHCSIDPVIARCGLRLLADNRRSFELCERILAKGNGLCGPEVCRRARELTGEAEPFPEDIEIELTTDDELDDGLYPRRPSVARRGPMAPEMFERLAQEVAAWDDVRVTLGGFGEPTRHPRFGEILDICRAAGIFGLHVQTNGLSITKALAEQIVAAQVDVVSILVDADDPQRYREVHGFDGFGRVLESWDTLLACRRSSQSNRPVMTAVLTKAGPTLDGLEAFYDGWIRRGGSAVITGYTDRAGQRPDHAVVDMQPANRSACRRLGNRVTILADGTVPFCEEDFNGRHPAGHLARSSLQEIWQGEPFQRLRAAHQNGRYDAGPLCTACRQWHRP